MNVLKWMIWKCLDLMPLNFTVNICKLISYYNCKNLNVFISSNDNKTYKDVKVNTEYLDLIYIDNSKSFGDVLLWIQLIKNLDENSEDKYYCYVHKNYKNLLESLNFKNIIFIWNNNDFGSHYNRKKIELYQKINLAKSSQNNLYVYKDRIRNIYLMGYSLIIDYLINLYPVKDKNISILSFNKKLKFSNLNMFNDLIFGSLYISKIHEFNLHLEYIDINKNGIFNGAKLLNYEKKLNYYEFNYKEIKSNNDTLKIAIMPFSSSDKKDLNLSYLKDFFDFLMKEFKVEVSIYGIWNKIHWNIWNNYFSNYEDIFVYKVNLYDDPYDLMQEISKDTLVITNDTSLFHIGVFYNKKTIVFYNNYFSKPKFNTKNFWLEYGNNEKLIIELETLFFENNKNKKNKKNIFIDKLINIKLIDFIKNNR